MRARRSDHSSAQLASAQLARSEPNCGASNACTGAGAGKLTKGRGVAEAAAVDGLPAIAATAIKTMIADPRFPDVFLAMSSSLSPQISTYREVSPLETTLLGGKSRSVPLQGEGTAQFTLSRDQWRARQPLQIG